MAQWTIKTSTSRSRKLNAGWFLGKGLSFNVGKFTGSVFGLWRELLHFYQSPSSVSSSTDCRRSGRDWIPNLTSQHWLTTSSEGMGHVMVCATLPRKPSPRTLSHPAAFTAVNFLLPKMEANLCRQTHPWCKYTGAKSSINKSVPSSGKQLHGCFYLLLSVSLIGVQKVSKFLMTAAFPIPACCMTFRYWKQMNNWKQFDHATFRCFWSLPKRPQKTPCSCHKANTSINSDILF